jgi:ankyrin repeat protein
VLLQHGCNINAKDENGTTIAHIACEHGHHEYLEGLIDAGYDVDLNVRTGIVRDTGAYGRASSLDASVPR